MFKLTIFFLFLCLLSQAQVTLAIHDYKTDSSYSHYSKLRFPVAKAQINALKNGALLVRLKTNANTINRLKEAGNIDLATQVERETYLTNKIIMRAYLNEFHFCPVYFFYSNYSDSVKHQKLEGILLDSNLIPSPHIICKTNFYLVAEQGSVYESSLGLVSEDKAETAKENGTASKEVAIVVKNRYFIQLHKPFPYYQNGYVVKKFGSYVRKFNASLTSFYSKNKSDVIDESVRRFVY